MKLTPQRMRRGLIATGIASAALLLPAVALASSAGSSATTTAAVAHRCYQGDLTGWLGVPGDGAAGSTFYQLELSNTSGGACTLFGYPGVSATRNGHQVGSAASRDHSHPSRLVTLQRGGTVHVILQITDVGDFSPSTCRPTTASFLRVYAPGDFTALGIPFPGSFGACGKRGPVYLHVSAVIAGTGIPGFSS